MSVGIDTLTAAPLTIDVGGRPLQIAPLTLADIGRLQAWVDAQLFGQRPDPIAVARQLAEGFPVEVQSELLREAYRDARDARMAKPTAPIGTPEAEAIVGTTAGIAEVLALALKKHQPEMGPEDAATLMGSLLPGDLDAIFTHVFGAEATPGPKAEGPGTVPTGAGWPTGPDSIAGSDSSPSVSTPSRSAG